MNCKGLIHIYFGNGKGKTTAAIGLSVRCAGGGGKVLFCQFLKDGLSGEINALKKVDGIKIIDGYEKIKFIKYMTEEEKKAAEIFYKNQFNDIVNIVNKEEFDLLVLDEIIDALNIGFLDLDEVLRFLENRPIGLEVALTGRKPDSRLFDIADYVSDVLKIKHPFDKGIGSRKMIEK